MKKNIDRALVVKNILKSYCIVLDQYLHSTYSLLDSLSIVSRQSVLAIIVACMTVLGAGNAWGARTYTAISDLSELATGDSVIIAIQDGKTTSKWWGMQVNTSNNLQGGYSALSVSSNSITNPNKAVTWKVTKNAGTPTTYTFTNTVGANTYYIAAQTGGTSTYTTLTSMSSGQDNNWYITHFSSIYFKFQITNSSGRWMCSGALNASNEPNKMASYATNSSFIYQVTNKAAICQYACELSILKKETGFDVTYNNGGHGTAPSNTTATAVTLAAITGVTGYTCTGWKANVAVTNTSTSASISAGTLIANGTNVTLSGATTFTAQWSAKQTTVSFNQNSGTGGQTSSVTATYDAAMPTPITCPTRDHYDFEGYYDGVGGTGTQYYTNTGASARSWNKDAATATLYAKWTEHSVTNYRTVCSATYDITLDDGEVADTYNGSAKVASGGTQLKNISAPTKTGYKVAGYYAESGKTNKVAAADGTLEKSVTISETAWTNSDGEWVKGSDATLYAKWEAISYSVRFNKNNESATGTMSNESYDYDESKALTSNAFSLTGYTFAGWATTSDGDVEYDDKESVSNLSSTDGAVVDLYAIWTANKYTLTLSASGETSSVGDQTVQATYGSSMPLVTTADGTPAVVDPSKTGYTFDGWEYNSTQYYSYDVGEDEISSAHVWDVANTATLTPRWNVNSYTLTWNLAGGTVTEAGTGAAVDATGTPSSSVNYGASITAPTVTKAGYTFAGWDVTPASTMPASNTTYTATWTEKTVTGWTFTNHRGGATITSDPIVIYVGQKVRMDIAYLPADVLSTHTVKENYAYTRSDGNSYLIQEAKASAYFTFSGKAAKSSTSITFTHTEDTSDPKAFAKTVNVEIRALPTDTYLDLVHGVSFSGPYGATLIDSDYGVQFTYTAPGGDVSDWSSSYANTCEQYHVHLIGWVESTWADEHLGDAEMPDTDDIISSGYYHPVGETMTVSGKTYYAVWAKVE